MQYIDAHCHLLNEPDLAAARVAGAVGFVCNGVAPDNWGAMLDMARCHHDVHAAVGVHPWYVHDLPADWDVMLSDILSARPNCMLGEVGLDNHRPDMLTQLSVFQRQLEIAHRYGRTAHIHCVGAWGALMNALHTCARPDCFVLHSYSGAADLMPALSRMGAYFSFGAGVLDCARARARRAVGAAPIDRILIESDAPDSRTTPADMQKIIFEIAKIRDTSDTCMADILCANAQRMLNNG